VITTLAVQVAELPFWPCSDPFNRVFFSISTSSFHFNHRLTDFAAHVQLGQDGSTDQYPSNPEPELVLHICNGGSSERHRTPETPILTPRSLQKDCEGGFVVAIPLSGFPFPERAFWIACNIQKEVAVTHGKTAMGLLQRHE